MRLWGYGKKRTNYYTTRIARFLDTKSTLILTNSTPSPSTVGKEMATHYRILAWETPWTDQPEGIQYMGSGKSWT